MNINSLPGQNPINSPDPNIVDNVQTQSTNLSSETKSIVATSDNANNINNANQNIESLESKTQNNNMSANMLKNNLLAKVPNNQSSTLSTKLNQIGEFSQDKNYSLTLSLPKDSNNQTIEPNKLTTSDYENTFIKATLREVGIDNVTDKEVKLFQQEYKNATGKDFSLKSSLTELRSNTTDGKLAVKVSQYDLAVAKTVGLETIVSARQTRSQTAEKAYESGTKYVDDLMKGYIAARINAPANLINGATEPIRGLAAMGGIDLSNMVVPRLEVAKESEYWNQGSRIADEELGTTLGLASVVGGSVDKQLLSNSVGKTVVAVESAYNLGTAAAGVDPTNKKADGTYQELSTGDRALRVVGGVLGARSVTAKAKPTIDPVNPLNLADRPSTTNLPSTTNKSTIPPGPSAPAVVTPDGATFNWRMPLEPTLKPSIPSIGGNISRPSIFTPGLAITGVRENQSSNGFGGPLGRPDPLEAKNHLIIDPTPEGQARQVRELRESLSPEAKQLFDDEYKTVATNQEFLLRISKTGDPAKMYEARAKKVSPEGVEAQNQARLASEARINQAKLQLDNPTFLNKQQVKDAIVLREPNDLRAEIAVELARQEVELKYPASDGYKIRSEVKLLEEIPGFSTKKEWELANPGKPSNYIFEKDNKIYQPATDIDLVVIKQNPKNGLSEIVYLEQIKSGHKDQYIKGKAQMDNSVDILKHIASGDPTFLINEKRSIYTDTTKEYDLSSIDRAKTVVRGPERRDSVFDKSVGLSTDEMNRLSEQIIKGRNP